MDEASERELTQTMRRNVLEELHLLASREKQLEYQRNVPIAFVTAELFCMWEECFRPEWVKDDWFWMAFSSQETQALETLNDVVEVVLSKIDKNPPSIEEFILTAESEELAQTSAIALKSFT